MVMVIDNKGVMPDPEWHLLAADLVKALARVRKAKADLVEAEADVTLVLKVAQRMLREHPLTDEPAEEGATL